MRLLIFLSLFFINTSWAEVGKVLKLVGGNDAYLMRDQSRILLSPELLLELGDELYSQNTHAVIHIFPGTQISLSKNTRIKLTEHLIEENEETVNKSSSVIDFIGGIIRATVTREGEEEINQKIQAEGVAFGIRGTEFEVSQEGTEDVELDVFEGSVEVTSPDVHTFVPEIVKANEGFKFNRKQRKFSRRKFAPKFKNHPGFENSKQLRQQWKEARKKRRSERGLEKQGKKAERQNSKNERMNKMRAKKGSRDK